MKPPQVAPAAFTPLLPRLGEPVPAVMLTATQPVPAFPQAAGPPPPSANPHLWLSLPQVSFDDRVAVIDTVENVLKAVVTLSPSTFSQARGITYDADNAPPRVWVTAAQTLGGQGAVASLVVTSPSPAVVATDPAWLEGYPMGAQAGVIWRGNYNASGESPPGGYLQQVNPSTGAPVLFPFPIGLGFFDLGLARRPRRMVLQSSFAEVWALDSNGEGRLLRVPLSGFFPPQPTTGDDMAVSETDMERGGQFVSGFFDGPNSYAGHGGGAPSRFFSVDSVSYVASTVTMASDFGGWTRGLAQGPSGLFSTWAVNPLVLGTATLVKHDTAGNVLGTFSPADALTLGLVFLETSFDLLSPYAWVEAAIGLAPTQHYMLKVNVVDMVEVARVLVSTPISGDFVADGVFTPGGPP